MNSTAEANILQSSAVFTNGARERRPLAQYTALAFLFLATAAYQARHVRFVVSYLEGRVKAVGDIGTIPLDSPVIGSVSKQAEIAGVRPGDTLIALNGKPYRGLADIDRLTEYARPGNIITVTVRHRTGVPRQLTVRIPLAKRQVIPSDEWYFVIPLHLVLPISCALLGFWLVFIRPKDPLAWLLLAMLLGFGQVFVVGGENHDGTLASAIAVGYTLFFAQGSWLWLFLLGLYFPSRFVLDRRAPWVKWLLIVPLAGAVLVDLALFESGLKDYSAFARLPRALGEVINPLPLIAIGLFFASIGAKYFLEPTPDAKRRLRLLYSGTFLAVMPTLTLVLLGGSVHKSLDDFPAWIELPALLLTLLFPFTFAYVIVVQRAMDVRLVIRQGLQYALARRGIIVVQILLSAALFSVEAVLITSHSMKPVGTVAVLAAGLWGIFLLHGAAQRVAAWIDRRFFRDAYNAEQILSELAEKVRTMVETQPLLETVAQRIADALHVPRLAVLLNSSGPYRPECALGYRSFPAIAFPEAAATVQVLKKERQPLRVYFDDPQAWIYRSPEMTENERAKLAELRSELLLPLLAKDDLIGFMSLGQKLSEAPYSGTDLRLLNSVAAQTSLALEVSMLSTAVAQETAQRERLKRELKIAREVQEHLFPQQLPAVHGLDYCGQCRPAREVGGDYYDFLELPEGKLGVAVGDVSGKGIGAALVMASLEASLRGQTSVVRDLAELVKRLNHMVYQASSANRYATFFYAEYDPQSRQLSYVNAGHNPPLVWRKSASGQHAFRLETGGPVIGLLPNAGYQQETFALEIGDLVVLFTDGVSESMNSRDEEWGEERLVEYAKTCEGLSSLEALNRIMSAAVAFAEGAPQHDDMTLVVLCISA
jgi:phosphoserine phosphatase RsbU/P